MNGSGRHNNWSIITDTGRNLLDGGKHPEEDLTFLLMLAAVITAVDEYPELPGTQAANLNDMLLASRTVPENLPPAMQTLRNAADAPERLCPADLWPMPTYGDLLYGV